MSVLLKGLSDRLLMCIDKDLKVLEDIQDPSNKKENMTPSEAQAHKLITEIVGNLQKLTSSINVEQSISSGQGIETVIQFVEGIDESKIDS